MMREFIGDHIQIDGRMIGYRIFTVVSYLEAKGLNKEEIEDFAENNNDIYELINQIIAIRQSCWLLRRTSHSCGSLTDSMSDLRLRLTNELQNNYNYDFDDELMQQYYC